MNATLLACMFVCCQTAALSADAGKVANPPVRIEYLETRDGKPPLRSYVVRLTLVNEEDRPVWFVMAGSCDKVLPMDGNWPNKDSLFDQPFGGKEYKGDGGLGIEVSKYGGLGFRAFRLPAKGELVFENYWLEAWNDTSDMVFMRVEDLKVNGKTRLEDWLPYPTMCGAKVKIGREAMFDWENLDWDKEKNAKRTDYPKEKVEFIKAEGLRSWTVKFQPSDKKNAGGAGTPFGRPRK